MSSYPPIYKSAKYSLLSLPSEARPDYDHTGHRIRTVYQDELAAVRTPAQLSAFILRWRGLWELSKSSLPYWRKATPYNQMISGKFSKKKVLRELNRITRQSSSVKTANLSWDVAINIKMPWALLRASIIAHQYQTLEDAVLIQLFGPMDLF